ncbi:MAG: homoserine dehydrogenase, partial [Pseudomonadota bacterium]|nr:homoserine dehydrogenase [Pseudomonadota bacterium]
VGIAGLGTVAQGVLELLAANRDLIEHRSGLTINILRIASRTSKPEVDLHGAEFSTDVIDLLNDSRLDVIVELMGGEDSAKDLIVGAIAQGKAVVTANKAVIARHGNELARQNLRYEAAVAGAIPIIQALRQGLVANRFSGLSGIINGTCNYMLSAMEEEGVGFDEILQRAQALGYAEADPSFDVDGIDAAHKLTILMALAYGTGFEFSKVYVEGIRAVTPVDIGYASELGYRIKHLGLLRNTNAGIEARVHPTLVPRSELMAHVNGVLNAVQVVSDASGKTLFSGPGAGGAATASAVVADIVASGITGDNSVADQEAARTVPIMPIEEITSAYYLRIPSRNEPGVFAEVAQILSSHDISIDAVIQKDGHDQGDLVDIVLLTQETLEARMNQALGQLQRLAAITDQVMRIRVAPQD